MCFDRFRRARRGMAPISAVFMLLLMFAAVSALIIAYFTYNLSEQEQMKIEHERSQEKIVITQLELDNKLKIANITIRNTGTIEVKIRALYREEENTTFLTDPSTYTDAHIAIGNSLKINISRLGLMPDPESMLIAATERGTKSLGANEIALTFGNLPSDLNTSQLTVGPLMLTFTSLQWTSTFENGNPVWPDHANGWTIPGSTSYCAWRLNVTDVDPEKRSLSINQNSGLTIGRVGQPACTTWYLNVAQQTLNWNQSTPIIFLGSCNLAKQKGVNNVFLLFFGNYSGGYPFGQTVPFESITVT